ncbi:MAG: hypothetical protein ACFFCD_05310 [Promethearchaeota archaeon]
MIYKHLPGTTLSWSINLPESKCLYQRRRIHCPISVLIRRRNNEEMHIILDSLTHLVDLLIRDFDNDLNILGIPSLSLKRALRSISEYFSLDDDFMSDLEYEYFKFLVETGFPSPFGFLKPRKLSELHEQSLNLKRKLHGLNASEHEMIEEAIEILDKKLHDIDSLESTIPP